jgi:ArsR family transcriptional regulator, lead/cadmium/zinc/bismuth-responsive transcriptional repressor
MRRQPLSDASAAALAETFRALGDLTRVRMLDALARSELCVQDLAARLHLTESAVSHQLRLLRNMRLVRTRRDGRLVFYALDDQHIVGLFEQGLEHVEEREGAGKSTSVPAGREGRPRRPSTGLGTALSTSKGHSSRDDRGENAGLPRRSSRDGSGAKAGRS